MALRTFSLDKRDRERLAVVCQVLGTTFAEFAKVATLHALDEVEGDGRYRRTMMERLEEEQNGR